MTKPDMSRFPDCMKHKPLRAILKPGQTIYIPTRWAHDVVSLDDSLSITTHWLTKSNMRDNVIAAGREQFEQKKEVVTAHSAHNPNLGALTIPALEGEKEARITSRGSEGPQISQKGAIRSSCSCSRRGSGSLRRACGRERGKARQ